MNDIIPAILALILIGVFAALQWRRKVSYWGQTKATDMPPGMTYSEAIKWLQDNYKGPTRSGKMSLRLAHQVLMKLGYQCVSREQRVTT